MALLGFHDCSLHSICWPLPILCSFPLVNSHFLPVLSQSAKSGHFPDHWERHRGCCIHIAFASRVSQLKVYCLLHADDRRKPVNLDAIKFRNNSNRILLLHTQVTLSASFGCVCFGSHCLFLISTLYFNYLIGGICAVPAIHWAVCLLLMESQKYVICFFWGVTVTQTPDRRVLPSVFRGIKSLEVTRVLWKASTQTVPEPSKWQVNRLFLFLKSMFS